MSQSAPNLVWSSKSATNKVSTQTLTKEVASTSFRSLLRRAVFLPIAICLSLLVMLAYEFYELKSATSLALQREAVTRGVFEVRLLLLELQSGMRGFLLTRDDWFLSPFLIYQSKLNNSLQDLQNLLATNKDQMEAFMHTKQEIGLWLFSARKNIEYRRNFATGLPKDFNSFSGSMSNIRKSLLKITSLEDEKLTNVSNRLLTSQTSVSVILFGGILFVMGLMAFLSRYHLTLLARDFTATQFQLRKSEETFRFLAQTIPEMVWVARADGKLQWLNESWFRYFGISQETEFSEMPWEKFLMKSEMTLLSEHWRNSVANKTDFRERLNMKGANGLFRLFEISAKPLLDENGDVLLFIGTSTDIQRLEDERIEKEFQTRSNELLNSALDYEGTLKAITEISVPFLSDWATVTFFTSEAQANLRFFHSKHKDPLKTGVLSEMSSALIPMGPQVMEILGKGEPFIVSDASETFLAQHLEDPEQLQRVKELGVKSLAVFPILWGGKVRGVILLVWDREEQEFISKGIFLGKKLARLSGLALHNAGLHEAVRNSVRIRDEFISVASHEIKTPLTSLSLQIQLLIRTLQRESTSSNTELSTKNEKALFFCLDQIHRLDRLLDELLDNSRIQQGQLTLVPSRTDLSHLLNNICGRFKAEADSKGVKLQWTGCPETTGQWDSNRLDQVISNLLSNALKYGNSKPIFCRVTKDIDKGIAQIVVQDQGPGIPQAMQERIFERYQRVSSSQSINGLGLGLYISKMIVQDHGGTLTLESKLNEGSKFIVTLPLGNERFHSP